MGYDAVIFDNDGVLTTLSDADLLQKAIRSTFAAFDVADPAADHCEALAGLTVDELREVCLAYELDPHEFWRARDATLSAAQRAAIDDGEKVLYDDVSALESLDVPMGVVSNNQHETVRYVVERFGLDELFDAVYGREPTLDGLRRKKPDPYYLDRAVADLGAEAALYVGDSHVDVLAAERAGLDSAFVRREHRATYALDSEPTFELESLHELRPIVETGAAGPSEPAVGIDDGGTGGERSHERGS